MLRLLAQIERLRANEERLEAEVLELREAAVEHETALASRADPLDLAPIACLTLDRHGAVRNANRRALRLFGFGKQQLLGTPLLMLLTPGSRRRFLEHVVATRRTPDPTTFEVTLTSRERGALPARLSIRWTAEGEGHYGVALVDLSERNAAFQHGEHAERTRRLLEARQGQPANLKPGAPKDRQRSAETLRSRMRSRARSRRPYRPSH